MGREYNGRREGCRDIKEGVKDIKEGLKDILEGLKDIEEGLKDLGCEKSKDDCCNKFD